MNKDNAHLYLPLVKALSEGKTIQVEINGVDYWEDLANPNFDNPPEKYRIKPEILYVNIYGGFGKSISSWYIHEDLQTAKDSLMGSHLGKGKTYKLIEV